MLDTLVRTAFGQRRKQIVNSLSGAAAPAAAPPGASALGRDDVRRALAALSLPDTSRPEELAPPVFVALARELGWLPPA